MNLLTLRVSIATGLCLAMAGCTEDGLVPALKQIQKIAVEIP
jgi:hypothetical protein